MAFTYRDMGHTFHEHIFSIFSVMAEWIAEILFMLFFILLCNGQTIAEYKAYWLMGAPTINP